MGMRNHCVLGDVTTANGTIVEGHPTQTINGMSVALEGGHIDCPSCKSTGVIKLAGTRIPHYSDGAGSPQWAAEGDLCICKCNPPPRLIAGLQSISGTEGDARGIGEALIAPLAAPDLPQTFDRHFVVHDKATGQPISGGVHYGLAMDGEQLHNVLHEDGATAKAYAQAATDMHLSYLVQTEAGVRS